MRVMVRSFHVTRWMGPLILLGLLALIPFAFMLALTLTALAVVFFVVRSFGPAFRATEMGTRAKPKIQPHSIDTSSQVLDAEYEVKEPYEKG